MIVLDDLLTAYGLDMKWQYRVIIRQTGAKSLFRFFDSLDDAYAYIDTLPDASCRIDRRPIGSFVALGPDE